jgi:hypothetical protein
LHFFKNLEDEDDDSNIDLKTRNGTPEVDLEVLEYQVNQMRESLRASEAQAPKQDNLTNGHGDIINGQRKVPKRPLRRGDSDRTDTDTDDDDVHMRTGEHKYSSRTQVCAICFTQGYHLCIFSF